MQSWIIYASILKALEKKEKACCIFLDFAKAFDTVNYEILLTKLENIMEPEVLPINQ